MKTKEKVMFELKFLKNQLPSIHGEFQKTQSKTKCRSSLKKIKLNHVLLQKTSSLFYLVRTALL